MCEFTIISLLCLTFPVTACDGGTGRCTVMCPKELWRVAGQGEMWKPSGDLYAMRFECGQLAVIDNLLV